MIDPTIRKEFDRSCERLGNPRHGMVGALHARTFDKPLTMLYPGDLFIYGQCRGKIIVCVVCDRDDQQQILKCVVLGGPVAKKARVFTILMSFDEWVPAILSGIVVEDLEVENHVGIAKLVGLGG